MNNHNNSTRNIIRVAARWETGRRTAGRLSARHPIVCARSSWVAALTFGAAPFVRMVMHSLVNVVFVPLIFAATSEVSSDFIRRRLSASCLPNASHPTTAGWADTAFVSGGMGNYGVGDGVSKCLA